MTLETDSDAAFYLARREINNGMVSGTPDMAGSMTMAGPFPMARMESCFVAVAEAVLADDRGTSRGARETAA